MLLIILRLEVCFDALVILILTASYPAYPKTSITTRNLRFYGYFSNFLKNGPRLSPNVASVTFLNSLQILQTRTLVPREWHDFI